MCGCCKGSLWVHVQFSVILFCSCNLFIFSVLYQTINVFWASALLALASIKCAGSMLAAGFLLHSEHLQVCPSCAAGTFFQKSWYWKHDVCFNRVVSCSFYIDHFVPWPFCLCGCSLTCSPILAIWRHSSRARPLDVHSFLHLQESYPNANISKGVITDSKLTCGCFGFVFC